MKFKGEAELAETAVAYLLADGWDCYFEVAPNGYGNRADIVAVSGPITAIVETKMSLGFGVLAQCDRWVRKGAANYVLAAVPVARDSDGRSFAKRCARDRGIGVWEVPYPTDDDYRFHMRDRMGLECFHRPRPALSIRKHLLPEMKTQAKPGTRHGGYVTPFTVTCESVRRYLRKEGRPVPVREVVKNLNHHYCNDASARSRLRLLAEEGIIPGLSITREGRIPYFVLTEEAQEDAT